MSGLISNVYVLLYYLFVINMHIIDLVNMHFCELILCYYMVPGFISFYGSGVVRLIAMDLMF